MTNLTRTALCLALVLVVAFVTYRLATTDADVCAYDGGPQ